MAKIDPDRPAPLYLQIAEVIRRRIESGELEPGDSLEPLREAASKWSVNLHTVRHAYASLARDGLLEVRRGPGGTRVRPDLESPRPRTEGEAAVRAVDTELALFLETIVQRAEHRFDLGAAELAEAIRRQDEAARSVGSPRIYVVECSRWQCEAHIGEIEASWTVIGQPWVLPEPGKDREPPPGPALATYFHYNDIRRLWPRRFSHISFVDIHVDPAVASVLRAGHSSLCVCEKDLPTAQAVAADLFALTPDLDVEIEPLVTTDPDAAVRGADPTGRVLLPPRVWAQAAEETRADPRAVEIRYRLDKDRLTALAAAHSWTRREEAAPPTRTGEP